MKTRHFSALTALLLTAAAAQAQVTIGPRIGGNLASYAESKADPYGAKRETYFGGQVGVALNAAFGSLAFQPAVLVSQKGYRVTYVLDTWGPNTGQSEYKLRLTYLEVPLHMVYTTGSGLQLFAGPYLAVGIGGRYSMQADASGGGFVFTDSGKGDVEFVRQFPASLDNKAYARRFDAGLNGGIGYQRAGFQVQLGYGLGLLNHAPNLPNGTEPNRKLYNRTVQLTTGYFFGRK